MALPMGVEEDEQPVLDGEVVDDLEGEAPIESDDDDDDEGGAGPAGSADGMDVEDDSFHSFEGHGDAVLSVAWNPSQADLVATGGQDDRAYLWRVGQDAFEDTSGSLATHELEGHTDSVVAVRFNTSGSMLATASMDGTVKVWKATTGELLHTLEGSGGAIEWIQWHPRGDVLLAGTDDCMVMLWNAATGAVMQCLAGHTGAVADGLFTPDGKSAVTVGGEGDCGLRVWNPKTGECTASVQGHPFHDQGLTSVAVRSDNVTALTGAEDGSLRVSNISTQRVTGSLPGHEESVEDVGFSQHVPFAASASLDGNVTIWDLDRLQQRGVCQHPAGVLHLAWHPSQPLVVSGCLDGVVRCWDLRTHGLVRQWGGHTDAIQALCLSADGSQILTGSDDNTAKAFRLAG